MTVRVGMGFDVHPFDPSRPLVLAGVALEGPGLRAHSDGYAVAHAVADALLGPAGLADLGTRYPDDDDTWGGADSMAILADVVTAVHEAGWQPVNVDVVVAAEQPRLAPFVEPMCERVRATLSSHGADVHVSLTPKRGEGIGAVGRAEGIAVWAVALIERR